MSKTLQPFEVTHRLFCLIIASKTAKEKEVEDQWYALVEKAKKAGTLIPEDTIKQFSKSRPDLAHRLANTPA